MGHCYYPKASPGHTLIVPKRHFATYFEATKEELLALGEAVQNAKKILDEEFSPDLITVVLMTTFHSRHPKVLTNLDETL
jgi:diadenosine tetraphosphate (Ap4A) HIT family hydrolase